MLSSIFSIHLTNDEHGIMDFGFILITIVFIFLCQSQLLTSLYGFP